MREQGEILEINDDIAHVRMSMGDKCKSCNICTAFGENSKVLEADNIINAQIGDTVIVEVNPKMVVGHSFLVFIFPIILLLCGYFSGYNLSWPENISNDARGIIGAVLFFLLSFVILKMYNNKFSRSGKISARVIEKINRK
jgi:positive regulator of sigma E activity